MDFNSTRIHQNISPNSTKPKKIKINSWTSIFEKTKQRPSRIQVHRQCLPLSEGDRENTNLDYLSNYHSGFIPLWKSYKTNGKYNRNTWTPCEIKGIKKQGNLEEG